MNVRGMAGGRDDRVLDLDRAARGGHGGDDERGDVVHAHGDTSGGSGCAATSEQGGASARSAPARESEQLGHQAKWPNGGRDRG